MKVLRVLAWTLLAAALAACATPAKMRQGAPAIELRSSLPAKAVAICILSRWETSDEFESLPVEMESVDGGYTVSWQNKTFGYTMLLADVKGTLDGSITRYYKQMVLVSGQRGQDVIDCQESGKDAQK